MESNDKNWGDAKKFLSKKGLSMAHYSIADITKNYLAPIPIISWLCEFVEQQTASSAKPHVRKVKTFKDWQNSSQELEDFFKPFDEVDEGFFAYLRDETFYSNHSRYKDTSYIQGLEPVYIDDDGVDCYRTAVQKGDRYFYMGVLPEFKDGTALDPY